MNPPDEAQYYRHRNHRKVVFTRNPVWLSQQEEQSRPTNSEPVTLAEINDIFDPKPTFLSKQTAVTDGGHHFESFSVFFVKFATLFFAIVFFMQAKKLAGKIKSSETRAAQTC